MKVTMTLVDMCDGQYLTDHHNREGEQLLGAEVDSTTTIGEVREQLLGEYECCVPGPDRDDMPSLSELMAALDRELPPAREGEPIDPTLPEPTTAWYLVKTEESVH